MRVVHIITGLAAGGAEQVLFDTVTRSRHEVTVVALSTEGVIADRLRDRGVDVRFVAMRSNHELLALVRLAGLLRRLQPEVVHVHLFRGMLFGRLAARMVGIRAIVATEHSVHADSTEGRRASRVVRLLYRTSERLGRLTIAVSQNTRDVLVHRWSVPADRVTVIPNGVDTARLAVDSDERAAARRTAGLGIQAVVVVASGRMTEGKRFDEVIEAVRILRDKERVRDVRLVLIGHGEERERLEEVVRKAGLATRTTFTGEVADVRPHLALGDVFVSASPDETYGIAIVEAFVSGLPVVYVACPAVQDLPSSVRSERMVESKTGPAQLARSTMRALEEPAGSDHVPPGLTAYFDVDAIAVQVDDLQAALSTDPRRTGLSIRRNRRATDLAHARHDRVSEGPQTTSQIDDVADPNARPS